MFAETNYHTDPLVLQLYIYILPFILKFDLFKCQESFTASSETSIVLNT